MNPKNSFAPVTQPKQKMSFSMALSTPSAKSLIDRVLIDPKDPDSYKRASQFVTTLTSVVARTPKLQECDYNSIISAGLAGIALNLSLELGEFSIIPYGDVAQFQLQYKGLGAMAIRTGQYRKIKIREVRQGEFLGYDGDGDPIIRYETNPDKRDSLPIIGYYAKYVLTNGFEDSLYMTHNAILKHADRYSKAFDLSTYNDIREGKYPADSKELKKLLNGTPWYDDPESTGHQKMCKKTVIKQLFGGPFAPKTIYMARALEMDNSTERGDLITYDVGRMPALPPVNPSTGEVIEDAPAGGTTAPTAAGGSVSVPAQGSVNVPAEKKNAPESISEPSEAVRDYSEGFFGKS